MTVMSRAHHEWWRLQGVIALEVPVCVLCFGENGTGTLHEDSYLFVQVAQADCYPLGITRFLGLMHV